MNHSLLCALGVSHPSLNTIANMTANLYHEMKSSTKLTGAGGGGCAFTFLEDDTMDDDNGNNSTCIQERLKIVSKKIEALKNCESGSTCSHDENKEWTFQCFTSAVGGKGVLWH